MTLRLAPASRSRGSGRPAAARVRVALIVLASVAVLAVVALVGLRLLRSGEALPGVVVDGHEVGGTPADELPAALRAVDRSDELVTAVADGDEAAATARELGYRFHAQPTFDAVMRRGRQLNPFAALLDHARATWGAVVVDPVVSVDDDALAAGAGSLADELARPPVEGDLEFADGTVERVEPAAGHTIDDDALAAALRPAVRGDADPTVAVEREAVPPETTVEDVDAVAAEAERALSAPVTLTRGDVTWTLEPAELATVLTVERDGGELSLAADADAVTEVAGDVVAAVERDPVDAEIVLAGGAPQIEPSRDGFAFDAEATADQLLELATGDGDRRGELAGEVLAPERTTAEAEALSVTEQVASFTTEFTPGQSRVQNIRRIAELVDGVLLEPGEELSVNGHVGERTRAKGFTEGGAIFDGEFVTDVGGGVSQFATTLYNAAYFGGYEIVDFQPHSYYISRYPEGREATLDYPHVDLVVRNNSPHGLLVATSSTGSSVTVSVWGTTWVDVDSVTGERRDVTPPPTERRETDDLPPGQERVVQSGRSGFTVTVTRILRFPDGSEEREPHTTRYRPEPRIVEVGADDGGDGS